MVIDIHTHTFPDKIALAAVDKLSASGHIPYFSNGTVSGLKNSMEKSGIDYSVVLPVATNPLKLSSMNDVSIKLNGKDGLIYFGAVHPDAPDWYEELGRIANNRIKGIKIHPVYQDVDIDDIKFLRILDRAAELGLIVLMHAGDDIGFPGVVRCSPKMTANALKQVGNVKIILAHMGGWKNWQEVVGNLADTSAMLDTAFSLGEITPKDDYYSPDFLNLLKKQDFLRLVNTFGSERVLFGTDSPWTDQKQSLEEIKKLPLGETDLDNILYLNAKKLLKL
ncbi:MAG: amidohydrolase family protein [Acutalibacteraceae bacterium]|nr:amidohydrolase family protein [Acutalibacteraceae bacterium]